MFAKKRRCKLSAKDCQVSPECRCQVLGDSAKRRKVETQPPFNKNPGPKAQHERCFLPCTQVKGQ